MNDVTEIDAVSVRSIFDQCWPWFEVGIAAYGRTHEKEDVWRELCERQSVLITANKSAAVCKLRKYPTGMRSVHVWLVGGSPADYPNLYSKVEGWARQFRFHRITAISTRLRAADGWVPQGIFRAKSLLDQGTTADLNTVGYPQLVRDNDV